MDILERIRELISVEEKALNYLRIHLPVLYADGENVCVDVVKNKHSFFVSDNGFGLENAFAQVDNITYTDIERIGKNISKSYGLFISKKYTAEEMQERKTKSDQNNKNNGIVYLNEVAEDELNAAIMMVANASAIFSHRLVEENIMAEEISLKEKLNEGLPSGSNEKEEFTLPVIKKNANKEIKGNSYKG